MRPWVLAGLLVWCVVAMLLALRPFHFDFDRGCLVCRNGAVQTDGQLAFLTPGLARTAVPDAFYRSLADGGAFVVEAWITPANIDQTGPARILSYSADPLNWNLSVGQTRDSLVFRIRAGDGNQPGRDVQIPVREAFAAGRPAHLLLTFDAEGTRIAIDGTERLRRDGPAVDFAAWVPDFSLVLGNEATGDRPWLGTIERITMRSGAGDTLLADFDFTGQAAPPPAILQRDDLDIPAIYLSFNLADQKFGAESFYLHVAMLFPVGLLMPLLLAEDRTAWSRIAVSMLVVFAYALAVEIAQYFTTDRTASMLDLLSGLLGGALGTAGGMVAASQRKRPRG